MAKSLRSSSNKRNKKALREKVFKKIELERLLCVVEHEKSRNMSVEDLKNDIKAEENIQNKNLSTEMDVVDVKMDVTHSKSNRSNNATLKGNKKSNRNARSKSESFNPYGICKKELSF